MPSQILKLLKLLAHLVMTRSAISKALDLSPQERANLKRLVDYSQANSLSEAWAIAAGKFASVVALYDPHANPEVQLTYAQLADATLHFAAGLHALGIAADAGDPDPPRIALIADNSPRWCIADRGIITAGAANVVRSASADRDELLYILRHSGSTALVVENLATLNKLRSPSDSETQFDDLPIAWVVLLSDEEPPNDDSLKICNYSQLLQQGQTTEFEPPQQNRDTLATLIYTSGTTGKPKGAMLTHGNLLHQISTFGSVFAPQPGDRVLSILPSWHVYERTVEYFVLGQGCTQIYTSIRYFKKDFRQYRPNLMVSVPRIWESIHDAAQKQFQEQSETRQKLVDFFFNASQQYVEARRIARGLTLDLDPPSGLQKAIASLKALLLSPIHAIADRLVYRKVRAATGGQLRTVISGGGSLGMYLDTFFEIVGIELLVGYGLTETSPVLTARRSWHNLKGSSGRAIAQTEIRIVDPETRQTLQIGDRGLVLARGAQIMRGYYRNPEATQKAIDPEGWFDTGDLGWLSPTEDLILTGRAKDTIVLSNGENIEPQPIEDACARSSYIDQIMLVGQDCKSLGALIVPNFENLQRWAIARGERIKFPESVPNLPEIATDRADLTEIDLKSQTVVDLFRQELNREVKNRPGYRPDDRIGPFELIAEPFSIENGTMTQTLKIKRPVVTERYRDMIDGMFESSR